MRAFDMQKRHGMGKSNAISGKKLMNLQNEYLCWAFPKALILKVIVFEVRSKGR